MICDTVRKGSECPFMTEQGCSFNGGICHEVVEQCDGCKRTSEYKTGWYCNAFPQPSMKWKNGACNFATHVAKAADARKAKVNPLKASKRSSR